MVLLGLARLVVILGVFSLTSQTGEFSCNDAILAVYPDVSDCQSFYACSNHIPRKLRCNPGLLFDSESNQCVPESEAICARNWATDDLYKLIDESTENNGEIFSELGRNTNFCEKEGALSLVTADCHSYYVCKGGLITKETCGSTQVFNLLSQGCTMPEKVLYKPLCDDDSFPGLELVQDGPVLLNTDTDIFVDAAENQSWIPGNCVYNFQKCSFKDQILRHPNDNTKYYTCKDGFLCEQQCLNGVQFDPHAGRCGPFQGPDSSTTPCPAACSSNITVLDDGCSDDWRCDGLPVGTLLPDPDQLDCTVYFDCVNPVNGIPQSCKFQCAGGTTFNPYEQCCDYNSCVNFDCTTDTFKPPTMTTQLATSTPEMTTTTTVVPSTSTSTTEETTSTAQTTTAETTSTTETSTAETTTTTTETTPTTMETSSTVKSTTDSTSPDPTSTSTISSTIVTTACTLETTTSIRTSTETSSTSEPTSTSSPSPTTVTTVVTTSSTDYQTELPDTAPTASEPMSQTPPLGPCTTYPCITITIPTTTTPIPLWPLRRSREYISQFLIAFYSVFFFALLFLALFLRRRWVRRKIKDRWPFPNI